MPIRLSAVVAPSRCLRAVLLGWALVLFACAAGLGLGGPGRYLGAPWAAAACVLCALCAVRAALPGSGAPTVRQIDLSGVGRYLLTVQHSMAGTRVQACLLPGATVWPCCIVVRFAGQDGVPWPLVLLPDSMGPGPYRALAVALRAQGGAAASQVAGPPAAVNLFQAANS